MEKTLTLVRSYLVERWNPRRRSYEWKPGFGLRLIDAGYRTHIVDHVHLKQETEFIMLAVFEAWVEATNALKL